MSKSIWLRCASAAMIRRMAIERKREDRYANPDRRAQEYLASLLAGIWPLHGGDIAEYRTEKTLLGQD